MTEKNRYCVPRFSDNKKEALKLTESPSTFTGGCICKSIRYECTVPPLGLFLCHCADCQNATGGPFSANVILPRAAFRFTKGKPAFRTADGIAGKPVHHEWCQDCGCPVGMHSDAYTEIRVVRASTADDPDSLKPLANLWTCRSFEWHVMNPEIKKYETQPTVEEIAKMLAAHTEQ